VFNQGPPLFQLLLTRTMSTMATRLRTYRWAIGKA